MTDILDRLAGSPSEPAMRDAAEEIRRLRNMPLPMRDKIDAARALDLCVTQFGLRDTLEILANVLRTQDDDLGNIACRLERLAEQRKRTP